MYFLQISFTFLVYLSLLPCIALVTVSAQNSDTLVSAYFPYPDFLLSFFQDLNNLFNKYYKGLSRGIYKKEGPGVDGIYNQDISPNSILIEVGGVDNNIDEVLNTTEAISNILYYYIKGDNNG